MKLIQQSTPLAIIVLSIYPEMLEKNLRRHILSICHSAHFLSFDLLSQRNQCRKSIRCLKWTETLPSLNILRSVLIGLLWIAVKQVLIIEALS